MAIDFGRNLLMSIGAESTYNTYNAANHEGFYILPGARMTLNQSLRENYSARGQAGQSPDDIATGYRGWTLDVQMNLGKEAFAWWLFHTFGAVVTTTITTYKKHVVSINDPALGTSATPPSLSVRLMDDNREWHLSGGAIKRLTVNMTMENFLILDVSMVGGTWVDAVLGAAPTYTVAGTGSAFLLSDHFDVEVNSVSFNPESFEVTFERMYAEGPSESYQSGSPERVRLESAGTPAAFICTGTTRRIYDGITQFELMDAFTEFPITMISKVVAGEGLVAADSDGYYVGFNFAKCHTEPTGWEKEDSSGITLQKLTWRAFYGGTSTDIQVVTQDTLATPATAGTP